MRLNYKSFAVLFFILAVALRVLLCWSNPPINAFDNHFEPIFMIMKSGSIPAADACFECYHPPVFYWVSAMVGNMGIMAGMALPHIMKLLQFVSCFYGILTIGVIYLILLKLPLSNFSRLLAFGMICFLPRHIYMSAMNSNDTISYLFVALSVYLLIMAIERNLSFLILLAVSIVLSIALFTKFTSYVLLPIILVVFISLHYRRPVVPQKKVLISFIVVFLLPATLLSVYFTSNIKHYGSLLPSNTKLQDPSLTQPHDDIRLDFYSFKPWEGINTPIMVPGKMHSFWTLVYNGMWYDNNPKFLYFLDSNRAWWMHYYGWLSGEETFPGDNPAMSSLTKFTGSGLVALGLVPLFLIITGIYIFFRGMWGTSTIMKDVDIATMNIFPTLLLSNAAGIIVFALKLPVYSSVKASYFLNSLPAFAVFLGLGLMSCEKNEKIKWMLIIVFSGLFALVSLHILHIVLSLLSL